MCNFLLHTLLKMIIFNFDLDNTIIYSYKHDIGRQKRCVEIYQGREISFITEKTYELLKRVSKQLLMVPTTTRTIEQYQRIDLGMGSFPYVLACNGGVLLVDGEEDAAWYRESLVLAAESRGEIEKAISILKTDENRIFELRFLKELFLFTKSSIPEKTVDFLKSKLDLSLVDVFNNGIKVYVVPKKLNKGNGVRRLREKLKGDIVIAAGDSEFDIPMLEYADYAIAPEGLKCHKRENGTLTVVAGQQLFSEKVLERVWEIRKNVSEG